jgi:hypothetical protein
MDVPAPIETHKTRKPEDVKGIAKKTLSDDLYAPINTHLRELSEEEK